MLTLNFVPKEGQSWNIEVAKGYYLQQIAIQLEQLNETLKSMRKESAFWHEKSGEYARKTYVQSIAIALMTMKQEVTELFAGNQSMRLSEFKNKISEIHMYCDRQVLIEAIRMTDYLETRSTGNGYRVWLIT